eukprot:39265-Eustigmatos_ZCMA.PRE.1
MINEPHGAATWGSGDHSTDWRLFVESALSQFETRYPDAKWLYLVEGIMWGKDLSYALTNPIRYPASVENRLVYSLHSYGKSVVPSIDPSNAEALHQDWDHFFGDLRRQGQTLIVGEYGGKTDIDSLWMDSFVSYLQSINATDAFFWSLGPNSGDVGGYLLDDWYNVDTFKRHV